MRRNRQSTGGSHCNTPPGTKSGGENGGLGGAEHLRTPLLVVYSAVPAATTCTLNPLSARRIAHVKPCTPLPTTTAVMSSSFFFQYFLGTEFRIGRKILVMLSTVAIILCMLQSIAPPSGRFGTTHPPYASVAEISEADFGSRVFLEEYVNHKEPVVIRGVGRNWPASSLWSDAYIAAEYGDYMLTLEKKHESEGGAKQKATYVEYLANHQDTGKLARQARPCYARACCCWTQPAVEPILGWAAARSNLERLLAVSLVGVVACPWLL